MKLSEGEEVEEVVATVAASVEMVVAARMAASFFKLMFFGVVDF